MGRAMKGCQATVPAGDRQAEDSEFSGQAQDASLISQRQVEGLTARRSSGAQPTSQDCTEEHMGAIIHVKENAHELHGTLKELLLPFTHPSPLYETLVLPIALGGLAFSKHLLKKKKINVFIFFLIIKTRQYFFQNKIISLKNGSRMQMGNS